MSAVQSSFPENLDQVLEAVRETPRGRWFLENYESRLRNDSTGKILDSIAKLEKHIESSSTTGADQALVHRARQAIAAARHDIASIDQKPVELSNEAQLFARLANLAKSSSNSSPAISLGVERALRLVSELDQQLGGGGEIVSPTKPAEAYFKQDDAVFEPAPAPKIVKASAKPEIAIEATPRGAKLVIQRVSNAMPVLAEPPMTLEALPVVDAASQPVVPQSRIVIIRLASPFDLLHCG